MSNRQATGKNPIIGDTPGDTLHAAACAMSFIARVHADRADWSSAAEAGETSAPDPLTSNESRGLGFLCEAIAAALWFEVEGRDVLADLTGDSDDGSNS